MNPDDFFPKLKEAAQRHFEQTGRPLVTLSYAQSLDGSISRQRGESLMISGKESLHFTHQLRDMHDAILVGIGTVLADDPRLTVRSLQGRDPQPVILDTRLRFPLNARLWGHPRKPWIFTGLDIDPEKRRKVEASGGVVETIEPSSGRFLSLRDLLDRLGEKGVQSVMVEGGASVITSFLSEGLTNRAVITIAPFFLGGLRVLEERLNIMPRLAESRSIKLGDDVIVYGRFESENGNA